LARSKRRREQHRTAIVGTGVDRRAQLFLPLDSIESADDAEPARVADVVRVLGALTTYPAEFVAAPSSVALVLDDFAFDLHLGDRWTATGTHDGAEFKALAVEFGVEVVIAAGVDVRRSGPNELAEAAADGRLAGARVAAFGVQILEST
jgi:hypothetical protein